MVATFLSCGACLLAFLQSNWDDVDSGISDTSMLMVLLFLAMLTLLWSPHTQYSPVSMHCIAGTETAIALDRQEFKDLVVRQLEAYTEKPADINDLRNACRRDTASTFHHLSRITDLPCFTPAKPDLYGRF